MLSCDEKNSDSQYQENVQEEKIRGGKKYGAVVGCSCCDLFQFQHKLLALIERTDK